MSFKRFAAFLRAGLLRRIGDIFHLRDNAKISLWFYREAQAGDAFNPDGAYAEAKALRSEGQLEEADATISQLLERSPDFVPAINLRGVIYLQRGNIEKALTLFHRVVALEPGYAPGWNNIGNVHLEFDRLEQAGAAYRQALVCDRNYVEALNNLSLTINRLGRFEDAERYCRKALAIAPDFAGAHNNLANILLNQNRGGEAQKHYREALRLQPDLPEAHINLAIATSDPGYLIGAIDYYEKILERSPDSFLPHMRLCQAYLALNEFEKAEAHVRNALALSPASAEALLQMGNCLGQQAFLDESLDYYRRGMEKYSAQRTQTESASSFGLDDSVQSIPGPGLDSLLATIRSSYVFSMHYSWDATGQDLLREARNWAHAATPEVMAAEQGSHPNAPNPERRLRVGYVSKDFFRHSVAFFLEPLLREHDHEQVNVYGYVNLGWTDEVTERLKTYCDEWRNIYTLTNAEVCELIRKDQIDILVDLSGHTSGNRLAVFSARPAPVTVTYLGYPGTTGLASMDYRLTDWIADPVGDADDHASETLVRLDGCFLSYQPPGDAPDIQAAPALRKGYVTFGSFNNVIKMGPEVVRTWAEIMRRVEGSRLLMKGLAFTSDRTKQRYRQLFSDQGIDADRLDLVAWHLEVRSHLDLYGEIDIALDPFPYNGTATTCEALWMGVPVVTYAGTRHSARVGASLLSAIGHAELIGASRDDYVRIATQLAGDIPRLDTLRHFLRASFRGSQLSDATGHARRVERAYRQMWQTWCRDRATGSAVN